MTRGARSFMRQGLSLGHPNWKERKGYTYIAQRLKITEKVSFENAKFQKFKCDILITFLTLWIG